MLALCHKRKKKKKETKMEQRKRALEKQTLIRKQISSIKISIVEPA